MKGIYRHNINPLGKAPIKNSMTMLPNLKARLNNIGNQLGLESNAHKIIRFIHKFLFNLSPTQLLLSVSQPFD